MQPLPHKQDASVSTLKPAPFCSATVTQGKASQSATSPVYVRVFALLTWTSCSIAIVLFNKLVLSKSGFDFPMALTLFHCAANSSVLFVVFECFHLLPSPYMQPDVGANLASVAPIAALFAVSTILRNSAFMYLPVATIQLLSSGSPVIIYLLSCLTRLDTFRPVLGLSVLTIAGGCAWATSGSIATLAASSRRGVTFQVSGLLFESLRGVLLKKIMVKSGPSQSSLGLLYMVAPVAAALLVLPTAATELSGAATFIATQGAPFRMLLCINIMMAVCLNLSSFFFVKTCAITTTSVAALAKDSMVIMGSYALHPETASARVFAGYAVTLAGTAFYTSLQQQARPQTVARRAGDAS